MGNYKKEVFAIPNIIGYLRILLIPLFTYLYIKEDFLYAALIAAFSGITDMADGFIARKFNMITELGKLIDPIADKLTQAALILCLLSRYDLMWFLVAVFLVKELTMGLTGLVVLCKNKVKLDGALWFGKISTVVQFICMTFLFAFPEISEVVADILIFISAAFMLLAFVLYMREYFLLSRKSKKTEVKVENCGIK